LRDIIVDLDATDFDGNPVNLHLETDLAIAAAVVLDPASNGLALRLDDAVIERLEISGSWDFDAGRVHQMVNDFLIPELKEQLGNVPLTGSVLNVADYYLIPKGLGTEPGFVYAAVDFFRAPANDTRAPETAIASAPTGVVSPANAIVRAAGTDAEVPPELLRYRFSIDGQAQEPGYLRELRLGRAGITATYEVTVSALDLAGNEDPTPARATVTVDGVSPHVSVIGERIGRTDTPTVTVEWIAEDDLTEAGALSTRIEVLKLSDPEDSLSGELALERSVAAGESLATLELPGDGMYRIEVQVTDEAGNVGRSTAILTVDQPGGCSSSRPDPSLALVLLLGLGLAARRRVRD
jgi:MYXO-CTERM domain-containing protein